MEKARLDPLPCPPPGQAKPRSSVPQFPPISSPAALHKQFLPFCKSQTPFRTDFTADLSPEELIRSHTPIEDPQKSQT